MVEEALLESAQQLLGQLPQIMYVVRLIGYVFLVFFFGHIALRGWRGTHHFYTAFPVKAALGLASLITGSSIAPYIKMIPFFNSELLVLLQADLFVGGVISAFAFFVALNLISFRTPEFKMSRIGKAVPVLDDRLSRIEQTLFRKGILKPEVKAKEAEETAEKRLPGYSADSTSLNNDFWEVLLKKKSKEALVIVDAYSGRVKDVMVKGIDPVRVVGIAIIIVMLIFGALSFTGFSGLNGGVLSILEGGDGLQELIGGNIIGGDELDPSCVDIQTLLLNYGQAIINNELPVYDDADIRALIEENSGSSVISMYEVTHDDKDITIAVIENGACAATESAFCECLVIE